MQRMNLATVLDLHMLKLTSANPAFQDVTDYWAFTLKEYSKANYVSQVVLIVHYDSVRRAHCNDSIG